MVPKMTDEQRLDTPTIRSRIVSAILWATIAILALAMWNAGREAGTLRAELSKLRSQGGHLEIKDPQKFYAVRIPTTDPYQWAWRIHIPQNSKFTFRCYTGQMPDSGLPGDGTWRMMRGTDYGGSSQGPLPPGELLLRVHLQDQEDGQWQIRIQRDRGWSGNGYRPQSAWLAGRDWEEQSDLPAGKQLELSPRSIVKILHLRNESGASDKDPNRVAESIIIWMDDGTPTQR